MRGEVTSENGLSAVAFRWVVLAIFAMLSTYVAVHHEPWRDEADAWLAARDAGVWQLLKSASYSGTPILWYLLVMPLASMGLPFQFLEVLAVVLGVSAAWLLLFKVRLPLAISVMALAGYHLGYEYTIIARNYGLGLVLLFSVIGIDAERDSRPVVYGIVLALLANTGVHFFVLAGALLIAWVYRDPGNRVRVRGVLAACFGMFCCILQLYPRSGGQLPASFVSECSLQVTPLVLESIFGPPQWNQFQENLNLLVVILVLAVTATRPRVTVFLSFAISGLFYIFACKYFSGARHSGLLWITLLSGLALVPASRELEVPMSNRFREIVKFTRLTTWGLLGLCLLLSLNSTVFAIKKELKLPYSSAGDMARFIEGSDKKGVTIAAHTAPHTSSVLPHLERRQFYYPALGEWGSFMSWDAEYSKSRWVSNREAFGRAEDYFAAKSPPEHVFLFLTSTPFAEARSVGYRLMYKTQGRPIQADETYYLYGPISVYGDSRGDDTSHIQESVEAPRADIVRHPS